ncbi:MAG: DNA (cytosine-5-)-methyltransferase, partial [Polyangiaceae bacterium]
MGLFSGVGGIELGLGRAGHEALMLCEVDEAASAVLRRRFPDLSVHDDVCTLRELPAETKLIAGGFPCQDLSQAGKTKGIEGARSGLVGEVFRLVQKQRVPWILLENVPFMLQLSKGRALDVIVSALEHLGYAWAYRVVDTRAFGLPQRRRRVFMVASLEDDPRRVLFADEAGAPPKVDGVPAGTACGFYWTEGVRGLGWAVDAVHTLKGGSSVGVPSPPAVWLPTGRMVTPHLKDAERLQGFKPDWTKPAEAVARPGMRWKLVGNAVSVPAAKWVGECLAKPRDFAVSEVSEVREGCSWPTNAWNVGEGRFPTDRELGHGCRCEAPFANVPGVRRPRAPFTYF